MGSVLRWLPLGLLALLTACGPVYRARAEPTAVPIGSKGWGTSLERATPAPGQSFLWRLWAPGANR